jgi:hypothetical protein
MQYIPEQKREIEKVLENDWLAVLAYIFTE